MKFIHLYFYFLLVLIFVQAAIITTPPASNSTRDLPQKPEKNNKVLKISDKKSLDLLREKVQNCAKGQCNAQDPPVKLSLTEELKNYAKQVYEKLKSKPSYEQFFTSQRDFQIKSGKIQTEQEAKINDDIVKSFKQQKSSDSFAKQSKSFFNVTNVEDGEGSRRLLESMNNEYQQFDEGNLQVNAGSKFIYLVRTDPKGYYRIVGIKSAGTSLSVVTTMIIEPGYSVRYLLVSNNYLIIAGSYYYQSVSKIFIIKVPINPLTGAIIQSNSLTFLKVGYLVNCVQKNNRAIIVTQQQFSTADYYWNITGTNYNASVPANSYGFAIGRSQNILRAVWNIGMNSNNDDYYFEEFFFGDWISFINIGNSDNLYITSNTFQPGLFNIQIVQSVVSSTFDASYTSGNYEGTILKSFCEDEYYQTLRVVSTLTPSSWAPVSLFYRFSIPVLLSGPAVDVSYGKQYLLSCLFVKDYAYLTYTTAIKATTGGDAGTDYPQNYTVTSLHKYALNHSVYTGYIIGFGYYRPNPRSELYKPIVLLYKVTSAEPLKLETLYFLTQGFSFFSFNYFWNHQSLLIDFSSKSIVFSISNYNTSEPLVRGMFYLKVLLNPPCLTPGQVCQPSPPIAQVYKHWDSKGNPVQYPTLPSEMPYRFTIVQQGVNTFLYSTSFCQMQARKIDGTPFPLNTVSKLDLC